MIQAKDHKTIKMFDPWWYLGPKRQKLLKESWPGLFREYILNELRRYGQTEDRLRAYTVQHEAAWADKHICPEHTWLSGKPETPSLGSL